MLPLLEQLFFFAFSVVACCFFLAAALSALLLTTVRSLISVGGNFNICRILNSALGGYVLLPLRWPRSVGTVYQADTVAAPDSAGVATPRCALALKAAVTHQSSTHTSTCSDAESASGNVYSIQ